MPPVTYLFVGTAKGLFRFASPDRKSWRRLEPAFTATPVQTTAYDPSSGLLFAAVNSEFYGPSIRRSRDLGATWDQGSEGLRYEEEGAEQVRRVWAILPVPGGGGTVYAGVEAAGLFRSDDHGAHWTEVSSLRAHPSHADWQAGAGGKCLHTLAVDPFESDRVYAAISAAGFFRSDDRGQTWLACNRGIRADFLPEEQRFPRWGQCVHNFACTPARPGRLWLQNHGGVYRSDDRGDEWLDVGGSLPADFGFPVVAHPRDGDCAFVVPLVSDTERWPPGRALAVYRTRDGGASWQALGHGLPTEVHVVVLRDAFAADGSEPLGLYLGTTSGSVFASADEGASWQEVARHLPRISSVRAVVAPS